MERDPGRPGWHVARMVRRFVPLLLLLVPSAIAGRCFWLACQHPSLSCSWRHRHRLCGYWPCGGCTGDSPGARTLGLGLWLVLCAGMIGGATSMFCRAAGNLSDGPALPKQAFVAAASICFLGGQIPHLVSLVGFRLLRPPVWGWLRSSASSVPWASYSHSPATPHQPKPVFAKMVFGHASRRGSEPPAHRYPGVALRGIRQNVLRIITRKQ